MLMTIPKEDVPMKRTVKFRKCCIVLVDRLGKYNEKIASGQERNVLGNEDCDPALKEILTSTKQHFGKDFQCQLCPTD
jgi:hypothetical protein